MRFADHFSALAAAYANARPSYPPGLFAWIAAQCPEHQLAWDVGCGNGQASVALTAHFRRVFASDPSASQIANALPHPHVRYAVEPAERSSLAAGSVDLLTAAQAYHWFDHARFGAEAHRVLKSAGIVAVWTYGKSYVNAGVDAVFDELHDVRLASYWPKGREHVLDQYASLPFPFDPLATGHFEMRHDWTLGHYLAYLRSWSACRLYAEATGRDAVTEVANKLAKAWGDPDTSQPVHWPLTVKVGRRSSNVLG